MNDRLQPRRCARPGCGVVFTPRRKNQRYHSRSCANQASEERGKAALREGRNDAIEANKDLADATVDLMSRQREEREQWSRARETYERIRHKLRVIATQVDTLITRGALRLDLDDPDRRAAWDDNQEWIDIMSEYTDNPVEGQNEAWAELDRIRDEWDRLIQSRQRMDNSEEILKLIGEKTRAVNRYLAEHPDVRAEDEIRAYKRNYREQHGIDLPYFQALRENALGRQTPLYAAPRPLPEYMPRIPDDGPTPRAERSPMER